MSEETDPLFLIEAQHLTESLEATLLDLKANPTDKSLIDSAFRDLHTLKGSGAMFGQIAMSQFLHDFETAFEAVREGTLKVTPQLIEIALSARDHVVDLLAGGSTEPGALLLGRLAALVSGDREAEAQDPGWIMSFRLAPDTLTLGGRPEAILAEFRAMGASNIAPILDDLPPLEKMAPAELHIGWRMDLPGEITEDDIRDVFLFNEEGLDLNLKPAGAAGAEEDADISRGDVSSAMAAPPAEATRTSPPTSERSMMRVPAERLDEMMDRVGELVIAEARLAELAARSRDPQLVAVAEDIERLASGMRETTMSIRMTPIETITGRFRRLVHDLTGTLGKPITLEIEGQDTELDKTVIEKLSDPLMHLIRNAADHGLETAEQRRAMGKPEHGTIRLSARYSGAEVIISLSDDGRGLELEKIRARAEDRGLIGPDTNLDDDDVRALILQPGFSTADAVTELSGRGVGMDVVKRTIEQLRGRIDVDSEPGHGTRIDMRLPLTLAIIDGLLVEIADERYAIPLAAVEHIIELPDDEVGDARTTRFLNIRDQLVPYLRMRDLLASKGVPGPHQKVVVVTAAGLRVGLTVDRIIGSSQTVIKQLSPLHAALKMFSGATVLGNGSVALILDIPQLVSFGQTLDSREAA
ncbi:chemotaxis protein CheA [Salipiger bermudensis]|uniref:chemotaxis protein CheA n=1 Tax=Salipiger bermudensis TaxID=344736 RepID=UPI001CD7A35D|nr:chemotaxis protein CheA [Salipiger bermudensis]MCA0964399.1 chemotaxis protein CheA [Salipiger bermudensis]